MKVVLKHGGRWLHFQCPEKVLVARRIDEVLPMLAEAEQSGLHAAGFVSYEAAPAFDEALTTRAADMPLLYLGLFPPPEILDDINAVAGADYQVGALTPSISPERFASDISAVKEQIAAGATYQVNHTYRLNGDFAGDAWAFFRGLVQGQRAEYAAFVETDECAVCSASPELFFEIKDGVITSRPMKGTAPRGRTLAEDWARAEGLEQSEKDRAENIMIVDMIRNDIGRVAVSGSVETVSLFDVEKYPTVWQMTSTITGRLNHEDAKNTKPTDRGVDLPSGSSCLRGEIKVRLVDVMRALFPCSSITGAPKAKTMEIIAGLETSPRGVYTGAIGFSAPNGDACFNVAIRTAVIREDRLEFGVGGGIVWDSATESEYEETLTKARVLTQPRPEFQLLETMLWEPESGIYLLREHMRRLGKSAAYFDVPVDMHAVLSAIEETTAQYAAQPHRVRLLVSRDGNSEIEVVPMPAAVERDWTVALAKEPVDSEDVFLYHKTTHRAMYDAAKADFPDRDEVILWNERGEVTEGTFTNVVVSKGGKKITPPVECGLLGGTFRAHLLESGAIEEGVVLKEDLYAADGVWLINSVRGWIPTVFPED